MPASGALSVSAMTWKPGGRRLDAVAVAHPDVQQAVALGAGVVLDVAQQLRMSARPHLGIAVFAMGRGDDGAAELGGHGLEAVADAKHRHAEVEDQRVGARGLGLMHGLGSAGEDDAAGAEGADGVRVHVVGVQLAVDPRLAHPAGDELGVLGPEVEDEDAVGVDVGHGGEVDSCQWAVVSRGCGSRSGAPELAPQGVAIGADRLVGRWAVEEARQ